MSSLSPPAGDDVPQALPASHVAFALVTLTYLLAVESRVRHLILRKNPAQSGITGTIPLWPSSQQTVLHAGEKKDNMLTLIIHVLTIMLWAAAAIAACGIAIGFLARTVLGRPPYGNHSRPVAAAIRWERNWHR